MGQRNPRGCPGWQCYLVLAQGARIREARTRPGNVGSRGEGNNGDIWLAVLAQGAWMLVCLGWAALLSCGSWVVCWVGLVRLGWLGVGWLGLALFGWLVLV